MTAALVEFLLARIAEDEAVARAAFDEPDEYLPTGWVSRGKLVDDSDLDVTTAEHMIRFDPARVLAECESKRQIITELQSEWDFSQGNRELLLGLMAIPYADHPDYRSEWDARASSSIR